METDFEPFDWERITLGLQPPLYLLEVALKCVVIFCLLLLVMRLLGKRGQNNLSPMQQMLLIALGSAAGDALLYPMVPLLYAALILVGITLLTVILEKFATRSGRVRRFVESHPRLLIAHGMINEAALDKERTTLRELHAALRVSGARSLSEVEYAILEVDGDISVFRRRDHRDGDDDAGNDLLRHILERDHEHERNARAQRASHNSR